MAKISNLPMRDAAPKLYGPLMGVDDVITEIYGGNKSAWWIRHHFAPEAKLKHGRTCLWERDAAWAWALAQRESRAASV